MHPQILSETSIEWPPLLNNINVEYCNTVSVSSCTPCKLFAWKSDCFIIKERLEWYDCEMQLHFFKVSEYLFLCRSDRNCYINLKTSCWSQTSFSYLWKMLVRSWSCDQVLMKQKLNIIDFQTIRSSYRPVQTNPRSRPYRK